MLEEQAVIEELQGQYAWVTVSRQSACDQCSVSKGCGTSVISRGSNWGQHRFLAVNQINAKVGDQVLIALSEQALVTSALFVYALPLLTMILFALISEGLFGKHDLPGIFGGVAGLFFGLLVVKRITARLRNKPGYYPVVTQKLFPIHLQ